LSKTLVDALRRRLKGVITVVGVALLVSGLLLIVYSLPFTPIPDNLYRSVNLRVLSDGFGVLTPHTSLMESTVLVDEIVLGPRLVEESLTLEAAVTVVGREPSNDTAVAPMIYRWAGPIRAVVDSWEERGRPFKLFVVDEENRFKLLNGSGFTAIASADCGPRNSVSFELEKPKMLYIVAERCVEEDISVHLNATFRWFAENEPSLYTKVVPVNVSIPQRPGERIVAGDLTAVIRLSVLRGSALLEVTSGERLVLNATSSGVDEWSIPLNSSSETLTLKLVNAELYEETRVVLNVSARWIESPRTHADIPVDISLPADSRDAYLSITVKSTNNAPFNLYVLDEENYALWITGSDYSAYLRSFNTRSAAGSIPVNASIPWLHIVVENAAPTSVAVVVNADLSYREPALPRDAARAYGIALSTSGAALIAVRYLLSLVMPPVTAATTSKARRGALAERFKQLARVFRLRRGRQAGKRVEARKVK